MNNTINWLEVFNSFTTFSILVGILISIWILILKLDERSKAKKR